ncbi:MULTISPECIES: hypothetical protein [unclassified Sphingomonas]|nr:MULTISPECIES: hypothetical protein [unclassified Sphingomonas]MDR6116514.1 hypothetical protein [Sphingomonas sp. SORGH_AS_0789]MDR6149811.1 hypothetical protein [Sphingomonas sp. SORGH_AS_0742]
MFSAFFYTVLARGHVTLAESEIAPALQTILAVSIFALAGAISI